MLPAHVDPSSGGNGPSCQAPDYRPGTPAHRPLTLAHPRETTVHPHQTLECRPDTLAVDRLRRSVVRRCWPLVARPWTLGSICRRIARSGWLTVRRRRSILTGCCAAVALHETSSRYTGASSACAGASSGNDGPSSRYAGAPSAAPARRRATTIHARPRQTAVPVCRRALRWRRRVAWRARPSFPGNDPAGPEGCVEPFSPGPHGRATRITRPSTMKLSSEPDSTMARRPWGSKAMSTG